MKYTAFVFCIANIGIGWAIDVEFKPIWESEKTRFKLAAGIELKKFPFYILLLDEKSLEPVPEERLTIKFSNGGNITLFTDYKGMIKFEINEELMKLNPVFVYPDGRRFIYIPAPFREREKGDTAQYLTIGSREKLSEDGIIIYYNKEHREEAKKILRQLQRAKNLIKEILNIEPFLREVIIDTLYPEPFAPGLHYFTLKYPQGSIEYITHEWAEENIQYKFFIRFMTQEEPRVRWIHDGVPEYIGYKLCRDEFPKVRKLMIDDYKKSLEKEMSKGNKIFDLTTWKMGESQLQIPPNEVGYTARYALSFYIWLKTVEQYGEGVIFEFLNRLKEYRSLSTDEAVNIFCKLTSDKERERIKRVNIKEALDYLNSVK